MFTLPDDVFDPRPGDTVIANLEGRGWQVMIIDHVVALSELVAFGDRGQRSFLEESTLRDSEPARWRGEVHVLVRLYLQEFTSPSSAAGAIDAGRLEPPTPEVLIAAGRLTSASTVLHASGSGRGEAAERSS